MSGASLRASQHRVEPLERVLYPLRRAGLLAAQRVVRLAEGIEAEHHESRRGALAGIDGEERRLRIALLEVLVDDGRFRQHPAVFLEDGDAAVGRVVLEQPGGPVG